MHEEFLATSVGEWVNVVDGVPEGGAEWESGKLHIVCTHGGGAVICRPIGHIWQLEGNVDTTFDNGHDIKAFAVVRMPGEKL